MTNGILDSGQKIITDGLVLNLDAAQLRSYPTTGTTWSDLSGNNNNGTLVNGATFNSVNGGSIVFDGVNDFVSTVTNFGTNPLPSHTLSVWFKTSVASGAKIIGIENQQIATTATIWDRHIYVGTNNKLYYGVYDTTSRFVTSSLSVTDNTWKNATAVLTGANQINLYINGILDSTGIGNGYSSYDVSYIKIGGYTMSPNWPNSKTGYFPGSIASVQVYNRALTAQEVLQNYNATKSRYGL